MDPSPRRRALRFGDGTVAGEIPAAQIDRDHLRTRGGSHRLLQIVNAAAGFDAAGGRHCRNSWFTREQPDAGVSRAGF
jgi:hypothetical protein